MQRGEVWWVQFEEQRLVVLLSGDGTSGIRVMQVVAPAGVDISGLGIEGAAPAFLVEHQPVGSLPPGNGKQLDQGLPVSLPRQRQVEAASVSRRP